MATILLSAAGAAVGAGFGGTVLGLSGAVIGRAIGATVGRVIDQRLLGRHLRRQELRDHMLPRRFLQLLAEAVPADRRQRGNAGLAGLGADACRGSGDLGDAVC